MIPLVSKSQRGCDPRTSVRPPGRLGTRSVDRSSHDVPGGLCNQSPWCWAGAGKRKAWSSRASGSYQGWLRRGASRPVRPCEAAPRVLPRPPLLSLLGDLRGAPRSSRRLAARRGLARAAVPATATAWQQRVRGAEAINNPPAAAAAGRSASPCKCAALSTPRAPWAPPTHKPFLEHPRPTGTAS